MCALYLAFYDIYFGLLWVEDVIIELIMVVLASQLNFEEHQSGILLFVFIATALVTVVVCIVETIDILTFWNAPMPVCDKDFCISRLFGWTFFAMMLAVLLIVTTLKIRASD